MAKNLNEPSEIFLNQFRDNGAKFVKICIPELLEKGFSNELAFSLEKYKISLLFCCEWTGTLSTERFD